MPVEYIHVERIKKVLEDQISGDISTFSLETLSALNKEIKSFLQRINTWQMLAKNKLNDYTIQYSDPDAEKLRKKLHSKEKKKALEGVLIGPGLTAESLLKEGYILIDEIRSKVTGETINYAIGVQYRGKLYEGHVSMQDIVSRSKVQIDGDTLDSIVKLRIQAPKGEWKSLIEVENDGIAFQNDHSSLYTSIRAYSIENKIKNWGNIYEAYKLLVSKQGSNRIPPAHFNEMDFIGAYLQTVRNTASYVQGGDVLNDQVKFFGGSAPSLTTLGTIRTTLQALSDALSTANTKVIQEAVKSIFMKKDEPRRAAEDLEEEIIKWAQEHLGKDLKGQKLTIQL